MNEAFLITSSAEGLQPLGSAAQRSYELVTGALRSRLGPDHAALFAEPVATEHGDMFDWYAAAGGTAIPLADLPEEQAAELRGRLGALVGDIRAEAERLAESGAADDLRLSEALKNAIEVPGPEMIFALKDADGGLRPVLAHWAWVRDETQAVRGILTAMIPRAGLQAGAAAAGAGQGGDAGAAGAGRYRRLWLLLIGLGWVLLALMLAYILYLLIKPCGLLRSGPDFCPAEEAALSTVYQEGAAIEDRIARLEHELALAGRTCRATVPVQPAAAPKAGAPAQKTGEDPAQKPADKPAETPGDGPASDPAETEESRADVNRRMAERGAARGALNFALEWRSTDDIDLFVTCPSGKTVGYANRTDCGGRYDLDANVAIQQAVSDPVENIVFDEAMPGVYKVRAHLRGNRTPGDKKVVLHVLRAEGPSNSYSGVVSETAREWITNISISR